MSTGETDPRPDNGPDAETETDAATLTAAENATDRDAAAEAESPRLDLRAEIEPRGPCRRHVKITVPEQEIQRQFDESLKAFDRDMPIPGFRPGKAPRSLIRKRYRKEVSQQVRSALILACLEQIEKEQDLKAISEPELDFEAIELPDEGPLEFAFDVDVQPDFELPDYKGLTVRRPVVKLTDEQLQQYFDKALESQAEIVPKLEDGAELGDTILATIVFRDQGEEIQRFEEVEFRFVKELKLQDAWIRGLDQTLAGVRPTETRATQAEVIPDAADPDLKGRTIDVEFQVLDLKTTRRPELDEDLARSAGFESLEELKESYRKNLERQYRHEADQAVRRQVLDQLLQKVTIELPDELVRREQSSVLQRMINRLQNAGYPQNSIRAREAELRANAHETSLRNLKEFFLLSKIGEAEDLKVSDEDIEEEIQGLAFESDESPRRLRSQLEKSGGIEDLRNQLLDRRTIDRILEYSNVELDTAAEPSADPDIELLEHAVAGGVTHDGDEDSEPEPESESESESESQD